MRDPLPRDRPLRLVLDTNLILDLLFWHDPGVRRLAAALERGDAVALGDPRCLDELRDVLGRPGFARDGVDPQQLFDVFSGRCQPAGPVQGIDLPALPRCKDAADQKFLELARAAGADLLVSRDKALLRLARKRARIPDFRIVTPAEAEELVSHGR